MSGLEVAAGVIGIADVSLKSIKGLYDFFQAAKAVPEQLAQIRSEISQLQARLTSLEFLTQADNETRKEVEETGIAQAMNDCGIACQKFRDQLEKWFKDGEVKLRGRLTMVWNDSVVQKNHSVIWSTARILDSAVGILTLRIVMVKKSPAEQAEQLEKLKRELDEWKSKAAAEQERVSRTVAALEEADDPGSEPAVEELRSATEVLGGFIGRCNETSTALQIKLRQTIQRIHNDEESDVKVGMPSSAVEKVGEQSISDIVTKKKGKAQIGIW